MTFIYPYYVGNGLDRSDKHNTPMYFKRNSSCFCCLHYAYCCAIIFCETNPNISVHKCVILSFGKNACSFFAYLCYGIRFVSQQSEVCVFRSWLRLRTFYFYRNTMRCREWRLPTFRIARTSVRQRPLNPTLFMPQQG